MENSCMPGKYRKLFFGEERDFAPDDHFHQSVFRLSRNAHADTKVEFPLVP